MHKSLTNTTDYIEISSRDLAATKKCFSERVRVGVVGVEVGNSRIAHACFVGDCLEITSLDACEAGKTYQ